jgi:acylphosphatase
MADDEVNRLLRIRGRVQGVGYRAFVYDQATRLGLRGWARNRRDGSVEVLVSGDRVVIDELIASLRRGPPGARVTELLETASTPDALFASNGGFDILPTL